MEYTVIRSGRKTICVQIGAEGQVIVRAPRRCPSSYIEQFVESKRDWILSHQQQVQNMLEERAQYVWKTGDTISFCGKPLTVRIVPGLAVRLWKDTLILPRGELKSVQKPLLEVFKKAAYPWVKQKLDTWAVKMGISYGKLALSTATRRWGSCSYAGDIRISVYLLMAPENCIDYVLVHELAHRKVFDHSGAFWAVVEQTMPDYDSRRQELRRVQQELYLQGFGKHSEE